MRVLLVDNPLPTGQHDTLAHFVEVQSVQWGDAIPALMKRAFDLVIINTLGVGNISLLVARIRFQKLCSRVVVVTEDPSWRLVRDLFHAGAYDCLHPDTSFSYLESVIGEARHSSREFSDSVREFHEQSHHPSS